MKKTLEQKRKDEQILDRLVPDWKEKDQTNEVPLLTNDVEKMETGTSCIRSKTKSAVKRKSAKTKHTIQKPNRKEKAQQADQKDCSSFLLYQSQQ